MSTGVREALQNLKVGELIQSLSASRALGYFNAIVGSAIRGVVNLYNNHVVPFVNVFTQPLVELLRARLAAAAASDLRLSSRLARARAFFVAFFDALKKYVTDRNIDLRFYSGQEAGAKFDALMAKVFSDEDIASTDKFIVDRVQKVRALATSQLYCTVRQVQL